VVIIEVGALRKELMEIKARFRRLTKDEDSTTNKYIDGGWSYLDTLREAQRMEEDSIEIALALAQLAPKSALDEILEIAQDEDDHSGVYRRLVEKEVGSKGG
jgi:rubrerythrin